MFSSHLINIYLLFFLFVLFFKSDWKVDKILYFTCNFTTLLQNIKLLPTTNARTQLKCYFYNSKHWTISESGMWERFINWLKYSLKNSGFGVLITSIENFDPFIEIAFQIWKLFSTTAKMATLSCNKDWSHSIVTSLLHEALKKMNTIHKQKYFVINVKHRCFQRIGQQGGPFKKV